MEAPKLKYASAFSSSCLLLIIHIWTDLPQPLAIDLRVGKNSELTEEVSGNKGSHREERKSKNGSGEEK